MLGPLALYLEIARLTMRGATRMRRSGRRWSSTWRPILPTRSMTVAASTPAACTSWSRAACSAMVKLARSGSTSGWVLVASVVEQGGGQPVDAGDAASAGGNGDLGVDHADLYTAQQRQPGPVGVSGQHHQLAAVLAAHQHIGLGGGDRGDQLAGGEVAVQQHDHPGLQAG